jgi:Mg-chelatase subunit ChlD
MGGSLADFNVVVDTEDRFVGTGIARDIARLALVPIMRWFMAI